MDISGSKVTGSGMAGPISGATDTGLTPCPVIIGVPGNGGISDTAIIGVLVNGKGEGDTSITAGFSHKKNDSVSLSNIRSCLNGRK